MAAHQSDARSERRGQTAEPLVQVRNLTFKYPYEPEPVLREVNLEIFPGELVILAGPSGSGKSTLCRHLNGVVPHLSAGEILSGQVLVKGADVARTPVHEMALMVGMVHQNPDSQLVCLEVRDELAFGPENIGLSHAEIVERVEQAIDWVGLRHAADLLTFECSGGQKQRLAIGSSLSLLPDLLVMDEPTTDLDPVGAHEVVATIKALRDELGLTFLIVEHDLDELLEVADRLIVMAHGTVLYDAPPATLLNTHYEQLEAIGLRIPQHIMVARRLSTQAGIGRQFSIRRQDAVRAFGEWAARSLPRITVGTSLDNGTTEQSQPLATEAPAVQLDDLCFSYGRSTWTIHDLNLTVRPGEFVALVGSNGSGKSTLAKLMVGLLQPQRGSVRVMGMDTGQLPVEEISQRVGYLFQNPDSQLFNTSVAEEVAFGMRIRKAAAGDIERRVSEALGLLGLEGYRERHPFSLSRGERQRLALATVLVADPDLIILDEPTTGQDRKTLDGLIGLMEDWIRRKQATVVMIAHDMDLVCRHASRTIVMAGGRIVAEGPTAEVFQRHYAALADLSLIPPPVVEMSVSLVGVRLPKVLLSIADLDRTLSAREA